MFSYKFLSIRRIFASYQNNQAKMRSKHKSCFPLLSMLCFLLTVSTWAMLCLESRCKWDRSYYINALHMNDT